VNSATCADGGHAAPASELPLTPTPEELAERLATLRIFPLAAGSPMIDISVKNSPLPGRAKLRALVDSGAQITIFREGTLPRWPASPVRLRSATKDSSPMFGPRNVSMCLNEQTFVVCAFQAAIDDRKENRDSQGLVWRGPGPASRAPL